MATTTEQARIALDVEQDKRVLGLIEEELSTLIKTPLNDLANLLRSSVGLRNQLSRLFKEVKNLNSLKNFLDPLYKTEKEKLLHILETLVVGKMLPFLDDSARQKNSALGYSDSNIVDIKELARQKELIGLFFGHSYWLGLLEQLFTENKLRKPVYYGMLRDLINNNANQNAVYPPAPAGAFSSVLSGAVSAAAGAASATYSLLGYVMSPGLSRTSTPPPPIARTTQTTNEWEVVGVGTTFPEAKPSAQEQKAARDLELWQEAQRLQGERITKQRADEEAAKQKADAERKAAEELALETQRQQKELAEKQRADEQASREREEKARQEAEAARQQDMLLQQASAKAAAEAARCAPPAPDKAAQLRATILELGF